jgi:drug/metabolite transporter (DMT)-like permease
MPTSSREFRIGAVFCIASAACYASLSVLGKLAFAAGITLTGLLSVRFLGAAILLAGLLVVLRRPLLPSRPMLRRLFLLGAVLYAIQAALYFAGLQRLPAGIASMLLYVYPVIVAALDWAVNHRHPGLHILGAMALALVGVALTLSPQAGGSIDLLGGVLVLASATGLSVYVILSETPSRSVGSRMAAMWITAGAGLSFSVAGAATGTLDWGGLLPSAWIVPAIIVFGTVLPVTLFLSGMGRVGPTAAALLSTLEPVFTVAMGVVWLAESPTGLQVAGGALVLTSAVLVTVRPRSSSLDM